MPAALAQHQPGLRRALEAFGSIASGMHDVEGRSGPRGTPAGWRESLIRGQRRVVDLYREVLATHQMPQVERTSILERVAQIEAELRALDAISSADAGHQDASFDYQRAA